MSLPFGAGYVVGLDTLLFYAFNDDFFVYTQESKRRQRRRLRSMDQCDTFGVMDYVLVRGLDSTGGLFRLPQRIYRGRRRRAKQYGEILYIIENVEEEDREGKKVDGSRIRHFSQLLGAGGNMDMGGQKRRSIYGQKVESKEGAKASRKRTWKVPIVFRKLKMGWISRQSHTADPIVPPILTSHLVRDHCPIVSAPPSPPSLSPSRSGRDDGLCCRAIGLEISDAFGACSHSSTRTRPVIGHAACPWSVSSRYV